jgi:hypothetical protein
MEFLQHDNENDSDKNQPDNENISIIKPFKNKWTELSDDDEESVDNDEAPVIVEQHKPPGILPKIDDIFSSVKTHFICTVSDADDHIMPFSTVPVEPEKPPVYEKKTAIKAVENLGVLNLNTIDQTLKTATQATSSSVKSDQERKIAPTAKPSVKGNKIGPAKAPKPVVDNEKDRDTAKDKVKRQRLGGQSGIGSDFKTWKTDEEMRQRQQYD